MTVGNIHFFEENRPVSASGGTTGATVSFYYTGTTNLAPIYNDIGLISSATNPVTIAAGAVNPSIFLDPTITYRRRTVFTDGTVKDVDPIAVGRSDTASTTNANTFSGRQVFNLAPSGSLPSAPANLFYGESINVTASSDTAVTTTTAGTQIPSLVNVSHFFGGSTINDGRNTISGHMHMTAATSPTNPYRFYAAGNFVADASTPDNGTGGSPQGTLYALGGVARMKAGATNWAACLPADFEISIETGASATKAAIVTTLTWPDHAVHGTLVDAHIWSSAAGVGMTNWAQIDTNGGAAPVTSTGTIIKASGGYTVSNGIDLSGITVSNWLLKGNGVIETTSTASATTPTTGAIRCGGGIGVSGNVSYSGLEISTSKTVTAPLTGDTVTIGATTSRTIINPAGTLANLTVVLPTAVANGDLRHVTFTQAITTLAWTGTTSGFPTTMARNSRISAIWDSGTNTWYLA